MFEHESSQQPEVTDEIMALFEEQVPLFDVGVKKFMDFMHECKEKTVEDCSLHKGQYDLDAIAASLEEVLDERWEEFGSEIASVIVSGRLHAVAHEDFSLSEALGVPAQETLEGISYFVEELKLVSTGPFVMPITEWNEEDGEILKDMHVGFGLALEGDEAFMPVVYAQEQDLAQLEFSRPTPAEAERWLEAMWPEQFEKLQEIASMRPISHMPVKLVETTEVLQHELNDQKFRTYAEVYLGNVVLDKGIPYMMTLERQLKYLASEYDDGDGTWHTAELEGPLSLYANDLEIKFTVDDETNDVSAQLFGFVPSEVQRRPEYICTLAQNISNFNSTKMPYTLVEKYGYTESGE